MKEQTTQLPHPLTGTTEKGKESLLSQTSWTRLTTASIKERIAFCGPFLMSRVMAGHEIQSEAEVCKKKKKMSKACRDFVVYIVAYAP